MRLLFSRRTDGAEGAQPDAAERLEESLPAERDPSGHDQSDRTEEHTEDADATADAAGEPGTGTAATERRVPSPYARTAPDTPEDTAQQDTAEDTAQQDTGEDGDAGASHESDTDSSESDVDGGREKRGPRNKRVRLAVAGLSVATVALLALGTVFGLQWYNAQAQDRLGQEALEVARQHSVNLVSINPKNIDKQMKTMLDGSTGEFKRQFGGVRSTFEQVVRKGKVSLTGSVDEAGLSKLSDEDATVLVAVKAIVKNSQTPPEGRASHYRFKVELERGEDRWLVSGMQFVP